MLFFVVVVLLKPGRMRLRVTIIYVSVRQFICFDLLFGVHSCTFIPVLVINVVIVSNLCAAKERGC